MEMNETGEMIYNRQLRQPFLIIMDKIAQKEKERWKGKEFKGKER